MGFSLIAKKDLPAFVKSIGLPLIAPVKRGDGRTEFKPCQAGEMSLDGVNAAYSPKDFFFPPHEVMMEFSGGKIKEVRQKTEERIIFGLRPCDANALLVLDKVFLGGSNDPYYAEKRKNTLTAVFDCPRPGEYCFCGSLGMETARQFDLRFVEEGEKYFVEAGSSKGKAILKKSKLIEKTSLKPKPAKLAFKRKLDPSKVKNLQNYWNDPTWKKTAERCLSCGACTMVCPTCTCFEIEDVLHDGDSSRARRWDSCQFKRFTSVSGQFVFRKERFKRRRHYVFHKLLYFRDEFGFPTCTGCGRCEDACPTKISIPETIGAIK